MEYWYVAISLYAYLLHESIHVIICGGFVIILHDLILKMNRYEIHMRRNNMQHASKRLQEISYLQACLKTSFYL